jgi:hypothetical protein
MNITNISIEELVVGAIVSGIIGMILQQIVIKFNKYLDSESKPMHGDWYEILPAYQGLPERIDLIILRQYGNIVTGKAKRISPKQENKRKWYFYGYVSGNRLIGFFYILNKGIDPSSYIPIILARDIHSRHEAIWRGVYYRPEYESDESIINGTMETGSMWWQKTNPKISKFQNWFVKDSEQIEEREIKK